MGSKVGYAEPILWAMGLRSGIGCDALLLNDPGPWSRVWRILTTPAGCKAVAAIIRGWIGEDARALWERLRAEAVPDDEGEAAARRLTMAAMAHRAGQPESGIGPVENMWRQYDQVPPVLDRLSFPPTTVLDLDAADLHPDFAAKYMTLLASNRLINADWIDGKWQNTGQGGTTHGGDEFATSADVLAKRVEDVAAWVFLHHGSFQHKGPEHGIGRPQGKAAGDGFGAVQPSAVVASNGLDALPPIAAAVSNLPAQDIHPIPPLPPNTYVYIDPPYRGTTGYAHKFPRDDVIEVAKRWSEAGAVVCVSEAEPLVFGSGWWCLDITSVREGQKRTFSRQQDEWLTMNQKPAWIPEQQTDLADLLEPPDALETA